MTVQKIQSIFEHEGHDLAFILGNGINLHFHQDNVSWNELLLSLWSQYASDPIDTIPSGISFTEFYDALEIQNHAQRNFSTTLQKEVVAKMKDWWPDEKQNLILNKIQALNAPLLTTNFDDLIPKSMKLSFHKFPNVPFTDYYPWSCYYSDRGLANPLDRFGVWYLNGVLKYHRSIKLGLSQYMGNVNKARTLIPGRPNISLAGNDPAIWPGCQTWLHILFNKSLFIVGLGLDESEIFIRWLLIERAKYFRRFPENGHKGWFVMKTARDRRQEAGKQFFLNSVGFEVIETDDYTTLYETIWE